MEPLIDLLHISPVRNGQHIFCIVHMSLLNEDLIGSFSQCCSVFSRERFISSFDKIMVESSVGVPWRTDGHIGKVQVIDRVGGDRGGNGLLLPLLVRLANKDPRADETKAHNSKPEQLCRLFPKKNVLKVNLEG